MYKFDRDLADSDDRRPFDALLLFAVFMLVSFLLANFLGMGLALPFFEGDVELMQKVLANPLDYPEYSGSISVLQGIISSLAFIAFPLIFLRFIERKGFHHLQGHNIHPQPLIIAGLTLLVMFFSAPVNSVLIEWNSQLSLPDSLSGVEKSLRSLEDNAGEMTKSITTFYSWKHLILGLIIIGVIPAIGEELVFRGLLQNIMLRITKNPHVAILLSAVIFSAIHMQFFGFVPRVFLGALLGYMYFWSRNIWVSIWGHFINNGGTVLLMYLYQKGIINYDVSTEDQFPWISVIINAALFAGCLYLFRRLNRSNTEPRVFGSNLEENI